MESMNIGVIGLGRMGESIVYRLCKANYTVFAYDPDSQARNNVKKFGAKPVDSIEELVKSSTVFWLMIPESAVDGVLDELLSHAKSESIIIDGGNSYFKNTIQRARRCSRKKIYYLDCGTSGGLHGREVGFSLMIGGNEEAYKKLTPLFKALAAPQGYNYMGPSGSGHYVKMIHNGIEYVILQAYADGFNLLKHGHYPELDLEKISQVWQHGSVIRSWILDLAATIFEHNQEFETISGAIGENKTGQWTLEEAKNAKIQWKLLEETLALRKWSRETGGDYSTKLVSLLRNAFGGHSVTLLEKKGKKNESN
jgi:6-phosphogluconate dehydrogenase